MAEFVCGFIIHVEHPNVDNITLRLLSLDYLIRRFKKTTRKSTKNVCQKNNMSSQYKYGFFSPRILKLFYKIFILSYVKIVIMYLYEDLLYVKQ